MARPPGGAGGSRPESVERRLLRGFPSDFRPSLVLSLQRATPEGADPNGGRRHELVVRIPEGLSGDARRRTALHEVPARNRGPGYFVAGLFGRDRLGQATAPQAEGP